MEENRKRKKDWREDREDKCKEEVERERKRERERVM